MSDKPVYQRQSNFQEWEDVEEHEYKEAIARGKYKARILYPASAYEAKCNEVVQLKKDRDTFKEAFEQWIEKTEWVQQDKSNLFFGFLGFHRADAMTKAIEALKAENEALRKIKQAAENLVNCKGRYHTEQNMIALTNVLAASKNGDSK